MLGTMSILGSFKSNEIEYYMYSLDITEFGMINGEANHYSTNTYLFLTKEGAKKAANILVREMGEIFGGIEVKYDYDDTPRVYIERPKNSDKRRKNKDYICIDFRIQKRFVYEYKITELYNINH